MEQTTPSSWNNLAVSPSACRIRQAGGWLCCTLLNVDFSLLRPDDDRAYGYVRFETGDEMSRRAKFAFITWIGPSVGPLKKAKVSTDKAFIKEVWPVSRNVSSSIVLHSL